MHQPRKLLKGLCIFMISRCDLESIGTMGRDLAKDLYTWDAQAERLLEYLNHILNR